ncbi:MAG: glutamate 5-kinase [Bacteroidales bacterium]|nr:glutamate 5-kinase [Bacteroidales bacterium]
MSRIVVKVGSNVLTRRDGTIDVTRVSSLVDQIAMLRSAGYQVILVTSGAVACGRSILGAEADLDNVEQRQVFSSVGQVLLMDLYHTFFRNYDITIGQVLTMKENFTPGALYDNQKGCMEAMLKSGVLPIVNENDTVSITELMFTDNDELSGLISTMMEAETLVILSNIDGVYDGDPALLESRLIRTISSAQDHSGCICESKSSHGRGGMQSKYHIARTVASSGIRVMIANGKREDILCRIVLEPSQDTPYTEFVK